MALSPITIAIIGAGGRGRTFTKMFADHHLSKVVAVADPYQGSRDKVCKISEPTPITQFDSWRDFIAQPKMCDAVFIATLDDEHCEPAIACMEKGYHLLLEKPMATSLDDCRKIAAAQEKSGVITAVCHSMRYNKSLNLLKEIIDSGRIGKIITIDQLEQVQWAHHAHSYVRGNWGNESRSMFMLMTKSCHDLDYLSYLVGKPCKHVSSFGSLSFFNKENAPANSGDRCVDCEIEQSCPYSAIPFYLNGDLNEWPSVCVSRKGTKEAIMEGIKTGPYGRCVWKCDNDVVDHQVVAMSFDQGITATFTMTAFTQQGGRIIRVHGSDADIHFTEEEILIREFTTNNCERISIAPEEGGHGGGDARICSQWLYAIAKNQPSLISTGIQESLKTHILVFAAETARKEKRVVALAEFQ